MGRITFANVTSDLFAMGVTRIDTVQLIIQICTEMTETEKDVVVPLMVKGFRSGAKEAGCNVSLGSVTENPWCTFGGTATALCPSSEFILPVEAVPGDVLVLTKPLGTQVACNIHHWLDVPNKWEKIKDITSKEELDLLLKQATNSMSRLNLEAAILMHKYNAHACTDVTGFGILGHAKNLVDFQKRNLKFFIESLPVFSGAYKLAKAIDTRLLRGTSPETSGGLLISMSKEDASSFCRELLEKEGEDVWIVGRVEEGNRSAEIIDNPRIIEVEHKGV